MKDFSIDFVGVGPQRTGSTWLHRVLGAHPALCLSDPKETYYFDRYPGRGRDWYAGRFGDCRPSQCLGEIGPTYFDVPEAPTRIHAMNPDAKVIVGLRDPVARAASLYKHHRRKGRVGDSFAEAARAIPRIVDAGKYADHVPRWIETFGREQVHFVLLDDVKARPEATFAALCDFLGVPKVKLPEEARKKVNAATRPRFPRLARLATRVADVLYAYRLESVVQLGRTLGLNQVYYSEPAGQEAPLARDERERLSDVYDEHVVFVEDLLDRALPAWKSAAPPSPAQTPCGS